MKLERAKQGVECHSLPLLDGRLHYCLAEIISVIAGS